MYTVTLHPSTNPTAAPKLERHKHPRPTVELEDLKAVVGGWVDRMRLHYDPATHRSVDIWCDDEGLLKRLRPTVWLGTSSRHTILCGPLIICAGNDLNGESVPLTEAEVRAITMTAHGLRFDGWGSIPRLAHAPAYPDPLVSGDPGWERYAVTVGLYSPGPLVLESWNHHREEEEAQAEASTPARRGPQR